MVRFLLTIVACNFDSVRCLRHGKAVYDFHDIKLPVATIVVGFVSKAYNIFRVVHNMDARGRLAKHLRS